jgi:hypothetical protein
LPVAVVVKEGGAGWAEDFVVSVVVVVVAVVLSVVMEARGAGGGTEGRGLVVEEGLSGFAVDATGTG